MSVTLNASTITMNSGAAIQAPDGSTPAYFGCRAWINFSTFGGGVAGTIQILGSKNISSIVMRGSGGFYTANFSTAMPDINYAVGQTGSVTLGYGGSMAWYMTEELVAGGAGNAYPVRNRTTSSFNFICLTTTGQAAYGPSINLTFHR